MSESEDVTRKRLSSVGAEDTEPELRVREILEEFELEFDFHRSDLRGTPDIVLPSRNLVIFVHGCFWHQHEGCERAPTPKKNLSYWEPKFQRNKERDAENEKVLEEQGWRVFTIWECETQAPSKLEERLREIVLKGET